MAAVGCAERVDTSDVMQEAGGTCPPWACSNSDEVMHYGMWEANLKGVANSQGLAIRSNFGRAQIVKDGVSYDLSVAKGVITGTRGTQKIGGMGLIGADITLLRAGVPTFVIRIENMRKGLYPVGTASPIEYYEMSWHSPDWTLFGKNVCNGEGSALREDLLGMNADETLVYEGDRYNPTTMTTSATTDANWFNFGCAGHTLAKLRLTRNTAIDNPDWRSRQASFKLLVADYCGTGTPFTVAGTPLRSMGGLMTYWPTPPAHQLEARWNENGATCLATPRLDVFPSDQFPNLDTDIASECQAGAHPLPPCTNTDMYDFDGALRITATPDPAP